MNKFIATFGSGQELEGYCIEIVADTFRQAIEYMEKTYEGKYCMVYGEDKWNKWVEKADTIGIPVEQVIKTITI